MEESTDFQESNNSDQSKDAISTAEYKNAQLINENAQLSKNNSILKTQVDQSINIEQKIEKIHEKNKQLMSENHSLKEEIDDIKKRYIILQKSNSDIQNQLEEEKQHHIIAQKQFMENSKKEIQEVKSQSSLQRDQIYQQLDTFQAKSKQDDITIKTFNNKIERLLQNATHYFSQKFNDIDDLISLLSRPPSTPNQIVQLSPNFSMQTQQETVNQLEKKLKKEKSKIKKISNEKDELEVTIGRLKREINEINNMHKNEINKLKKEKERQAEDQSLLNADNKHRIQILEKKVEKLTNKNDELKKKLKDAEASFGIPQIRSFEQNMLQCQSYQQVQSPLQNYQQAYNSPLNTRYVQRPNACYSSFGATQNYNYSPNAQSHYYRQNHFQNQKI